MNRKRKHRKLRAVWTLEKEVDLKAAYGWKFSKDIRKVLVAEIRKEIKQIIQLQHQCPFLLDKWYPLFEACDKNQKEQQCNTAILLESQEQWNIKDGWLTKPVEEKK